MEEGYLTEGYKILKDLGGLPSLREIVDQIQELKGTVAKIQASFASSQVPGFSAVEGGRRKSFPEFVGERALYWMLCHSLDGDQKPLKRIDRMEILLGVVEDAIREHVALKEQSSAGPCGGLLSYGHHDSMAHFLGDRILLGLYQESEVASLSSREKRLTFMLKVVDEALKDYREGIVGGAPQVDMSMFLQCYNKLGLCVFPEPERDTLAVQPAVAPEDKSDVAPAPGALQREEVKTRGGPGSVARMRKSIVAKKRVKRRITGTPKTAKRRRR